MVIYCYYMLNIYNIIHDVIETCFRRRFLCSGGGGSTAVWVST